MTGRPDGHAAEPKTPPAAEPETEGTAGDTAPRSPGDPSDQAPLARLLPYAVIGIAADARQRAFRAATAALGSGLGAARMVIGEGRRLPPGVETIARRHLQPWAVRGRAELRHAEEETAAAVRALIRTVANAVLDQLDLDAVVARVDPNLVVDRVDIDALLARVDLTARANEVLDELDISQIIRESSGGLAAESIDAFRIQSMRADGFVNRVAGRLLLRRSRPDADQGDTAAPPGPAERPPTGLGPLGDEAAAAGEP
ncbi:MAG TPA: hypothetical protein VH912_15235 [Streptosporangiaceae bacterium]